MLNLDGRLVKVVHLLSIVSEFFHGRGTIAAAHQNKEVFIEGFRSLLKEGKSLEVEELHAL